MLVFAHVHLHYYTPLQGSWNKTTRAPPTKAIQPEGSCSSLG